MTATAIILNKSSLAGQVALITGGGTGIGAALAHQLAAAGVLLVLAGRRVDPLEATATALKTKFPESQVCCLTGDVRDPATCDNWVAQTLNHFGKLDILVNNAGICGQLELLQEVSTQSIHDTIDTNLKGPIFLTQAALKQAFVPQQSGTLVNINSIAGKQVYPYWAVYCATKAGLKALAEAVQEEQRGNNIRVINLFPAAVATPLWEPLDATYVPDADGMLTADQVAEAALLALRQPASTLMSDITLAALQPSR